MPRIVFRGKTYYSVYEMPPNVRRAYEKELKKAKSDSKEETAEPATHPLPPISESSAGIMRGLVWGILVALILSGIAFLLSRLLP